MPIKGSQIMRAHYLLSYFSICLCSTFTQKHTKYLPIHIASNDNIYWYLPMYFQIGTILRYLLTFKKVNTMLWHNNLHFDRFSNMNKKSVRRQLSVFTYNAIWLDYRPRACKKAAAGKEMKKFTDTIKTTLILYAYRYPP